MADKFNIDDLDIALNSCLELETSVACIINSLEGAQRYLLEERHQDTSNYAKHVHSSLGEAASLLTKAVEDMDHAIKRSKA